MYFISAVNIFQFLVIKTLDLELDPHWQQKLNPDPQSGTATLVLSIQSRLQIHHKYILHKHAGRVGTIKAEFRIRILKDLHQFELLDTDSDVKTVLKF
jgi:hypothetical protein